MTLTTIQFDSEDEAVKQMALLASEARVCRTLQTPLETNQALLKSTRTGLAAWWYSRKAFG